ncbi:PREDICTED: LRR receptor-like serine/threonine-protein kinase GSO1 [Prunus mume]|uniref:LRR receptor-like serine/threonine-protein kinase GSO1 n=1 Tax=Prunus mume TaxID=102107 RepID=A0ABM1LVS5_PRUMU|nr:PREDICTED: LRR receptor-like serine/threonine-protein kinase GSO1 [Prunus mume]
MGHCSASAFIQLVSLIILSGILSLETIKPGFCNDDNNVGCTDIERKALLKLKQGLTDPSDRLSSWVGEDCCKWSGVGCNNITGRVDMLDLRNRYSDGLNGYRSIEHAFGGEINPSLLVLKDLVYLDLSMNYFGGVQLPSFIGSLEKLKYLNLSGASFGGIIPHNIGNLSRLLYLDLDNNYGHPIETDLQWLATLSSLKYLNLGGVNLAKTTSYWLPIVNMLPSLVELHLPSCGLSILPFTLPSINFTSLLVLDLSMNGFNCPLPPWLFNLTELEMLDLTYNSMTGELPDSLGYLKSLRYLKLSVNSFQGSMPKSIGNLTSLEEFNLGWNQMSGIIPESLWELSSLVSLHIFGNTWEGAITEAHFAKLGGLRDVSIGNDSPNISLVFNISSDWIPPFKLRSLYIRSCQLGPKFPTWLRNQTELTNVVLRNSRISDTTPDWFWQLVLQLDVLDIAYNQLSGRVPNSLRFSYDSLVDLSSNRYEGPLPLWSSNITVLYLSDNLFSGPIPHNIGQVMPNLIDLDISRNSLSGILDLSGNKFTSTIPPWLFNLTKLENLDFAYNSLTGKLPDSLGYLKSLRYLKLSVNSFQGSMPKSIGNLTSLEEFNLGWNQMSGIIPESLWELSSLVSLHIFGNTWEGAITEAHFAKLGGLRDVSIGNDSPNISLVFNISSDWIPPFKLRSLYIRSCQLGPKFPTWLRNQTELTNVVLRNSRISDTTPDWFWQLVLQLDVLDIAYNQLSGRVPNSLRFSYDSLVDLSSNRYEGPLPLWSSNITVLYLSDNLFSGPIPHNIGQVMPHLTHLDISRNSLSGSIPLSFGNLSQLTTMVISNNHLSGEIPHFWNNIPFLVAIDMSSNSLSGKIPRTLGSLTSLKYLIVSSNNLSGEVPSLKNCSDMRILDLGDNKFSGPIPASIGESMPSLKILCLRNNSFTGSIPLKLCGLSTLHILDLSHNNLSGNIPHCIDNLSGLKYEVKDIGIEVYGYQGRLGVVSKGRVLVYDSILYLVYSIDLSDNNLSGEIPVGITSLLKLGTLNLSMNHLTGNIPTNIGNLRSIETLDLSVNKLSGSIPQSMVSLTLLNHLNLSYNNLFGKIPTGNQFQTFVDPSIYEGNAGLSGCPLPIGCQENEETPQVPSGDGGEDDDDSKLEKLQFIISMVIGFCAGFWGVFETLAIKKSWRYAYFQFLDKVKYGILDFVSAIGTYLHKGS